MARGNGHGRILTSVIVATLLILSVAPSPAQEDVRPSTEAVPKGSPSAQPVELTADELTLNRETAVYDADGSVVVVQGTTRLTADHVTFGLLTGDLLATGDVHLSRDTTEVWSDRMRLNFNTEAGIIANGTLYDRNSNAFITGQVVERLSEDHYRAKKGTFTNCDAMEGETPDWRFRFQDVDLEIGDSIYLERGWFCVLDVPILPVPVLSYPVGVSRKTGFLIPTPGFDTRFGFLYRQSFFWALHPSHDLTFTANYLSKRGFGGDVEYRYALSRNNQGQWLFNAFNDTDQNRFRGLVSGSHSWQVDPDLLMRARAFVVSDRDYLRDLSNSATFRALPSADSYLDVRQRFTSGDLYLLAQYLQPVDAGSDRTFQRVPELGFGFSDWKPFGDPLRFGLNGTYVYFFRPEGFDLNRAWALPTVATKPLVLGDWLSVKPQVRPFLAGYTRGVDTESAVGRATFWTAVRADTRLSRWFRPDGANRVLHTLEPDIIYEFVPPTDQSDIVQIDEYDNLPKKSLLTYKLRTRLLHTNSKNGASNWLDFTAAQSYRLGAVQTEARRFPFPGDQAFQVVTQPLRIPTVPVDGKKLSDILLRGTVGREDLHPTLALPTSQFLLVDTFLNPYDARFSQINSDLRFQHRQRWYVQIGQRYTRDGNRVQRGDVWNPISFGDVFDPTPQLLFLTTSGAIRGPLGLSVGARALHNFETGKTAELDVVGLYQNPCRCWSLGVYFIRFPDRTQFNFLISLRDLGNTDSFGAQLIKNLLNPILQGEKGLPW